MKRSIFLSLTALLFSISSYAQANFTGSWTFKDQQSISGNLYANGSPRQVTITQNGSEINLTEVVNYGQDTTLTETLSLKKPFETKTPMGRKKEITLSSTSDGSSFAEVANIYNLADPSKLDMKETSTWTLANGELTLDRKSENFTNGETWESRAVYQKQ